MARRKKTLIEETAETLEIGYEETSLENRESEEEPLAEETSLENQESEEEEPLAEGKNLTRKIQIQKKKLKNIPKFIRR
jgi:hypothetical protein